MIISKDKLSCINYILDKLDMVVTYEPEKVDGFYELSECEKYYNLHLNVKIDEVSICLSKHLSIKDEKEYLFVLWIQHRTFIDSSMIKKSEENRLFENCEYIFSKVSEDEILDNPWLYHICTKIENGVNCE